MGKLGVEWRAIAVGEGEVVGTGGVVAAEQEYVWPYVGPAEVGSERKNLRPTNFNDTVGRLLEYEFLLYY
jgi:hypothetical protein